MPETVVPSTTNWATHKFEVSEAGDDTANLALRLCGVESLKSASFQVALLLSLDLSDWWWLLLAGW